MVAIKVCLNHSWLRPRRVHRASSRPCRLHGTLFRYGGSIFTAVSSFGGIRRNKRSSKRTGIELLRSPGARPREWLDGFIAVGVAGRSPTSKSVVKLKLTT